MLTLLLLLSVLQLIHSSCPEGFELVRDGECRGQYTKLDATSMQATSGLIEKCKEIDAMPPIIHDEEHQEYWRTAKPDSMTYLLTGLMCNTTSKRWVWPDGSALDYKPAMYDAAIDKDCTPACSASVHRDGYWTMDCQTDSYIYHLNIFCTTQLQQPVMNGCDGFDDDSEDGVCYQIGAAAETWQDAQMNCRKLGANLASIHNIQENSFIRRLAVSKGAVNGVFIGATVSGKQNSYGWIDGTEWDYENFAPGFPRPGFGECFAMDTTASAGQWENIDCAAKLPVACIREQKPIAEPTCSSETWKEGVIITSPGFPHSASIFCDYYLMTDVGKRIELEIVLLEANTCCDALIIYDGYLGSNILANVTGEVRNVTYTTTTSNIMRVTWHPNGGVNVMGMAMTFRGV